MKSKYKALIKNFIIFGIGSIGSKFISFILVPLYTNFLSSSDYGISDLVLNISSLIIPFVSLTFQDSILRYGLSSDKKENILKNSFLVFLFGLATSCALFPLLNLYSSISEWRVYLLAIVVSTMSNNFLSYYAKIKGKNMLFAISSIVQALALAITNIALIVFFSLGIKGFLLSNVVANLVCFLFLFFLTGAFKDLFKGKMDFPLLKQMLAFSLPLVVNNVSWWILNSSDKIMIEYFVGSNQLGLYTAASKIPNLLSLVTGIFASAWSISSINEFDSTKDFTFYEKIFNYFCLVLFFGGSVLLIISKDFYHIYVGKSFHSSWVCVPLLIGGIVFFSISSFFGSIYGAVKKNLPTTISTLLSGLINIVLNLFTLKAYGIVAASVSTFISYFFIAIYRMFNSRKYLMFKIDFFKFFVNCLIISVQLVFVYFEFNYYSIGVLALFCLFLNNHKDIKNIAVIIKNKLGGKIYG